MERKGNFDRGRDMEWFGIGSEVEDRFREIFYGDDRELGRELL